MFVLYASDTFLSFIARNNFHQCVICEMIKEYLNMFIFLLILNIENEGCYTNLKMLLETKYYCVLY